jgi:hypothetical protein
MTIVIDAEHQSTAFAGEESQERSTAKANIGPKGVPSDPYCSIPSLLDINFCSDERSAPGTAKVAADNDDGHSQSTISEENNDDTGGRGIVLKETVDHDDPGWNCFGDGLVLKEMERLFFFTDMEGPCTGAYASKRELPPTIDLADAIESESSMAPNESTTTKEPLNTVLLKYYHPKEATEELCFVSEVPLVEADVEDDVPVPSTEEALELETKSTDDDGDDDDGGTPSNESTCELNTMNTTDFEAQTTQEALCCDRLVDNATESAEATAREMFMSFVGPKEETTSITAAIQDENLITVIEERCHTSDVLSHGGGDDVENIDVDRKGTLGTEGTDTAMPPNPVRFENIVTGSFCEIAFDDTVPVVADKNWEEDTPHYGSNIVLDGIPENLSAEEASLRTESNASYICLETSQEIIVEGGNVEPTSEELVCGADAGVQVDDAKLNTEEETEVVVVKLKSICVGTCTVLSEENADSTAKKESDSDVHEKENVNMKSVLVGDFNCESCLSEKTGNTVPELMLDGSQVLNKVVAARDRVNKEMEMVPDLVQNGSKAMDQIARNEANRHILNNVLRTLSNYAEKSPIGWLLLPLMLLPFFSQGQKPDINVPMGEKKNGACEEDEE